MIDTVRCICCGAEFVGGKGFIEPHIFPCANERYGWAWTIKDSERLQSINSPLKQPERYA